MDRLGDRTINSREDTQGDEYGFDVTYGDESPREDDEPAEPVNSLRGSVGRSVHPSSYGSGLAAGRYGSPLLGAPLNPPYSGDPAHNQQAGYREGEEMFVEGLKNILQDFGHLDGSHPSALDQLEDLLPQRHDDTSRHSRPIQQQQQRISRNTEADQFGTADDIFARQVNNDRAPSHRGGAGPSNRRQQQRQQQPRRAAFRNAFETRADDGAVNAAPGFAIDTDLLQAHMSQQIRKPKSRAALVKQEAQGFSSPGGDQTPVYGPSAHRPANSLSALLHSASAPTNRARTTTKPMAPAGESAVGSTDLQALFGSVKRGTAGAAGRGESAPEHIGRLRQPALGTPHAGSRFSIREVSSPLGSPYPGGGGGGSAPPTLRQLVQCPPGSAAPATRHHRLHRTHTDAIEEENEAHRSLVFKTPGRPLQSRQGQEERDEGWGALDDHEEHGDDDDGATPQGEQGEEQGTPLPEQHPLTGAAGAHASLQRQFLSSLVPKRPGIGSGPQRGPAGGGLQGRLHAIIATEQAEQQHALPPHQQPSEDVIRLTVLSRQYDGVMNQCLCRCGPSGALVCDRAVALFQAKATREVNWDPGHVVLVGKPWKLIQGEGLKMPVIFCTVVQQGT